jgi:hypothetical protein
MRYQSTIELHKFLPCPVRGKQRISPLHSTRVLLVFRSVRCVELGIRGTRARSGFDGLGLTPKPFLFSRNHTQLTKLPLQELSAQEKGRTE